MLYPLSYGRMLRKNVKTLAVPISVPRCHRRRRLFPPSLYGSPRAPASPSTPALTRALAPFVVVKLCPRCRFSSGAAVTLGGIATGLIDLAIRLSPYL